MTADVTCVGEKETLTEAAHRMADLGVGSLPIILLVGFFSGAVAAQQAIAALAIFRQERFVGATVGVSLAQELAPVFTALMITARAGSGMATELGSMRVSEQIDALTTFAVSPIQYLITPRIVATVVMMPIMVMVFNIVGLIGAYPYSIVLKQVDLGQFLEYFQYWTDPKDYIIGGTKAAVFGVAHAYLLGGVPGAGGVFTTGLTVDEKISEFISGEKYPHEFHEPSGLILIGVSIPAISPSFHLNCARYME